MVQSASGTCSAVQPARRSAAIRRDRYAISASSTSSSRAVSALAPFPARAGPGCADWSVATLHMCLCTLPLWRRQAGLLVPAAGARRAAAEALLRRALLTASGWLTTVRNIAQAGSAGKR